MRKFGPGVAAILLLVGCAHWDIYPLDTNGNVDKKQPEGLRFNRPSLFLVVGQDDKGICMAQFKWWADPEKPYILQVHSGLGSVSAKPTLTEDGNLTSMETMTDSKSADLIAAISKFLPLVDTSKNEKHADENALIFESGNGIKIPVRPGVYRVDIQKKTVEPIVLASSEGSTYCHSLSTPSKSSQPPTPSDNQPSTPPSDNQPSTPPSDK